MRINVYSEEVTGEVTLVGKEGKNQYGSIEEFYGVRIYLHSSEKLHHSVDDDDRSAITFWLPKSSSNRQMLANALYEMSRLVENAID